MINESDQTLNRFSKKENLSQKFEGYPKRHDAGVEKTEVSATGVDGTLPKRCMGSMAEKGGLAHSKSFPVEDSPRQSLPSMSVSAPEDCAETVEWKVIPFVE